MNANKAHQRGIKADEVTYRWRSYGKHSDRGEWTLWAHGKQIGSVYDLWDVAIYLNSMRLFESRVAERAEGC